MEYICKVCKVGSPPRKWYMFGTVCPNCNEQYQPNKELEPYYRGLLGRKVTEAN